MIWMLHKFLRNYIYIFGERISYFLLGIVGLSYLFLQNRVSASFFIGFLTISLLFYTDPLSQKYLEIYNFLLFKINRKFFKNYIYMRIPYKGRLKFFKKKKYDWLDKPLYNAIIIDNKIYSNNSAIEYFKLPKDYEAENMDRFNEFINMIKEGDTIEEINKKMIIFRLR